MRIARAGWPFITAFLLLALALGALVAWWCALPALVLAGYMAYFFRDPEREPPADPAALVAPGDGRIVVVDERPDGRWAVSIFLGLLDVHVNRSPCGGTVRHVEHHPGRFLPAWRAEAAERNEQNRLEMETPAGILDLRQVVGVAARRIECWKQPGDAVTRGERIGIMKFGSRIDLVLPPGARPTVASGDRVRAGESVIARIEGVETDGG